VIDRHDPAGPVLSVIVAAHNAEPWIVEMLESVRAQDVPQTEVIVVENGSSDGTADVVSVVGTVDPAVQLVRSAAGSAGAAREEGIAIARGEYIVFADSDDIVPDGAYRAMLDALEASGSDMAIGDHLKFSASRTWNPTRRWYSFDNGLRAVAPVEVPELLSGRACWNRMFRRSFWDRAGLRFPDIASLEDIEPMTRAFVSAESVDIVPACVYLYRDRGDVSSLSMQADATVTVRYLEQESACAGLVESDPVLRSQHAEIVLDADGWAHLHRFLLTGADHHAVAEVAAATATLLEQIPLDGLADVAPIRRALWSLVVDGLWQAARAFVEGTTSASAADRLGAWVGAVGSLTKTRPIAARALALEGLVPAFVNDAEEVAPERIAQWLPLLSGVELTGEGDALPDAMIAAIRSGDAEAVVTVSSLRQIVPFVVDRAAVTAGGMVIEGPADLRFYGFIAAMELIGPRVQRVEIRSGDSGGRWRADIAAESLAPGRYNAAVVFAGVTERFPVVTARMQLPPVGEGFQIQPLADRKDGWRFLIDRLVPRRRGLGGLLTKVTRRSR